MTKWYEYVTGSLEDKKRYREYKARCQALPPSHRTAVEALERYLMRFGAITKGETLMAMLDDLVTLFEQAAADQTSVREVVGDDPVAFAEELLANYAEDQWINKERTRLAEAIDRAAAQERHP